MNYQNLVSLYPCIDLVLELFKGVMPTLVALLAIFLNNSFARKRELIYRKKNLQLDYYIKILIWFHDIKNDIMEVSLDLENALNKKDQTERRNRYNNFMKSISKMNTNITVRRDTYSVILELYNCDIELSHLKKVISNCSDNLIKTGEHYFNQTDTKMATDEINDIVIKTNTTIDKFIRMLLKEIDKLY